MPTQFAISLIELRMILNIVRQIVTSERDAVREQVAAANTAIEFYQKAKANGEALSEHGERVLANSQEATKNVTQAQQRLQAFADYAVSCYFLVSHLVQVESGELVYDEKEGQASLEKIREDLEAFAIFATNFPSSTFLEALPEGSPTQEVLETRLYGFDEVNPSF